MTSTTPPRATGSSILRFVRRTAVALVVLLLLSGVALAAFNEAAARELDHPMDDATLDAADLAAVDEARRLQRSVGGQILPGLDEAGIGYVVFNDDYEFLVTDGAVPDGWEPVAAEDGEAAPYHRRAAEVQQAFAIPLGDGWAASLSTRERMNRDYFLGAREQLPFPIAQLLPASMASIPADQYPALFLHEATHAFAATNASERFASAQEVYAIEDDYPFDDEAFANAWADEGAALHAALEAPDPDAARAAAAEFLQLREARRRSASLSDDLVRFERELEWLEGIPKYVEINAYRLAAEESDADAHGYRADAPYWDLEIGRLANGIEDADGDYRFYLTGMAMATVLDRIDPDWKTDLDLGSLVLEDELARAVGG